MSQHKRFRHRADAGRRLSRDLAGYAERDEVRVLALPRGGVPVAYEVARALSAPLDAFLVRRLVVPGHEELTLGAIAAGGIRVLDETLIRQLALADDAIALAAADQQQELERLEQAYRRDRPDPEVEGQIIILVDDGLATGFTMRAATAALRARDPALLVVAVPVAPADACDEFRYLVDDLVCLLTPDRLGGLDEWYEEFPEVSHAEVRQILERADQELSAGRETR